MFLLILTKYIVFLYVLVLELILADVFELRVGKLINNLGLFPK